MQTRSMFPPSLAVLPRVNARFRATLGPVKFEGSKAEIKLEFTSTPENLGALAQAQADGAQEVCFVSLNPEQRMRLTFEEREMAVRVSAGLALLDQIAMEMYRQRDPRTGHIEPDERRTTVPVMPVGTRVGDTREEALNTVVEMVARDPEALARAARMLGVSEDGEAPRDDRPAGE